MKRKVQYLLTGWFFLASLMMLSLPQSALALGCGRYEEPAYPKTVVMLDWFQGEPQAYLTIALWLMSVAGLSGLFDHLAGARKFGITALVGVVWIEVLGRILGHVVRCDDAPPTQLTGDLFTAVLGGTVLFAIPCVLLAMLGSWALIQCVGIQDCSEAPEVQRLRMRRISGAVTIALSITLAAFAVEVYWGMVLTALVIAIGSWCVARQVVFEREAFEMLSSMWIPVVAFGCAAAIVNVFMLAPRIL